LKQQPEGSLDRAQILVVDDHSTKDDPKSVVDRIWGGRVKFFRHEKNVGPCANFNACLDLAERDWIHMLHGDDYVFAGAYEEFNQCLEAVPDAIAVFARSVVINDAGRWGACSWPLGDEWRGRFVYKPEMWANSPVPFPGVLIGRRAIDLVGKFDCSFCHAQDCNLWWRMAKTGKVAYSNRCVAAYRESESNHTSSLLRTGKNLSEDLDQTERVLASMKEDGSYSDEQILRLYEIPFEKTLKQCYKYIEQPEAFAANIQMFRRFPSPLRRHRRVLMSRLRHFRLMVRRRLGSSAPQVTAPPRFD
jgi:glycosyltransferase involved in cell wall biosynthesis